MALTVINDPAFAGITESDKRTENHLSAQAFQAPIWDDMLFYQAPEWWMKPFLNKFAKVENLAGDNKWNWAEKGKWFKKQLVAAATDNGAGSVILELNTNIRYFAVKDVVDLGIKYPGTESINLHGRVTAVGTAGGGNQTITVVYDDPSGVASSGGTQIQAVDFPVDHQVALLYNAHGECFEHSTGRFNIPDQFDNYLTKIDNPHKICDDAANRKLWFKGKGVKGKAGRKYWIYEDERDLIAQHNMAVDNSLLLGQRNTFTDTNSNGDTHDGVKGDGIITQLTKGSLIRGFAGSVTEDDHIEMLTDLGIFSGLAGAWFCICGPHFFRDSQKALKDYAVNGSFNFGPLNTSKRSGQGNEVGINIGTYRFGNRSLNLMEYTGFGDPDFLTQNATGVNYRNFAMFLKMDRKEDICIKYKKRHDKKVIKQWVTVRYGQTMQPNSNSQAILQEACSQMAYTTHVGVAVKGLQKHGLMIGG